MTFHYHLAGEVLKYLFLPETNIRLSSHKQHGYIQEQQAGLILSYIIRCNRILINVLVILAKYSGLDIASCCILECLQLHV